MTMNMMVKTMIGTMNMMIDVGKDLQRAFDDGEWSMFEQITSAYYGKQYYFLQSNESVYSRLTCKTLKCKKDAYEEFINKIWEG